jgi:hypothetical protein
MNSVYIDSAVPSSPIYLGPNNASSVIIGNANCTTTLVGPLNIGTTTANTVNIGKEGASTNLFGITNLGLVTSGTKNSYIEVGTGGGNALIDFHSSGLFDTDNDSRIMGTGGTSTSTQGKLNYYAGSHVFNGNISMNTGSNIVLSGTIPTLDSQLGQRLLLVNNTGYTTSATAGNILAPVSFTLPLGVWLVTSSCQIISPVTYFTTSISLSTTTLDFTRWCVVSNTASGNVTNSIIATINNTSTTTTYYYLIQSSGVSATTTVTYIYATRIG